MGSDRSAIVIALLAGSGDEAHLVRQLERPPRVPAGEVGALVAEVEQDRESQLRLDPRPLTALVLDRVQVAGRLGDQGVAAAIAGPSQVRIGDPRERLRAAGVDGDECPPRSR
jgi:hypothetical protein